MHLGVYQGRAMFGNSQISQILIGRPATHVGAKQRNVVGIYAYCREVVDVLLGFPRRIKHVSLMGFFRRRWRGCKT